MIFSKYSKFLVTKNISKDQKLDKKILKFLIIELILSIIDKTNIMLKSCNHIFSGNVEYEISHHYGLEKFRKYGLVLLNVINGEYCKKILVIFPNQTHPEQYHKKKLRHSTY